VINVLIVDDERLTRELHREYVARMPGFQVVAECASARAALTAVLETPPTEGIDLVLLDMTMPDGHGLDVARHIRAHAADVDIIAITGVRDADVVRAAVGLGVVQYLVKPFSFAAFRERLEHYADYRRRMTDAAGPATQAEIDALLGSLRPTSTAELPKGLSVTTLDLVVGALRAGEALSAAETAQRLGMSRVAARRYLEHLANEGRVDRAARYGTPGRPETEYVWVR
jgi:response regulator of citrate/malate metabolism